MHQFRTSSSILNSISSNASLDSIENEEIEPWHGLIHKLSKHHLDLLRKLFKEQKDQQETRRRITNDEGLTKEEFVTAVDEVFDNCKYSLQATILFARIDKGDDNKITWNQFLDFLIEHTDAGVSQRVALAIGEIFSPPHVKRETIVKIVLIESKKHFCYAILSKYGRVGLYDGNMNFLTSYHVIMSKDDIAKKDEERRKRNRWITDAIYLVDVQIFIISTSARNITIYDASGLKHVPQWLIIGVPNIIHCFCYHWDQEKKCSILYMGDEYGEITSMTFLQTKNGLLRKKQNDKLNVFYWIELQNEKDFLSINSHGKLHNDNVRAIHFFSDNNTIASCSRDINASIVIKHAENRMKPYIFKMKRGASCFSLNRSLKLLITGSDDGTIRLWNIVSCSKPISILKSHKSGVIDIQIMENQELFLSCSREGILKLWSIKEQQCLQTLHIKFPSFQVLGKTIEWGSNSLYPGPKRHVQEKNDAEVDEYKLTPFEGGNLLWERSHIFVACCNYISRIRLSFEEDFDFDQPVLPPPPLQNSVLIPTNWKISDSDEFNHNSKITNQEATDAEKIPNAMDSLNFILNKDLLAEADSHNNINFLIATLETKKLQMKKFVSKCAPYLALDLQEIQEITLTPNLPLPNSKRTKNLIEKTQRMMDDASARSQIFSNEQSSTGSRTRSSRSSLISFD